MLQEIGGSRRMPALEIRMSRWDSWVRMNSETKVIPSLDDRSQAKLYFMSCV
jgi:hypothetical protein